MGLRIRRHLSALKPILASTPQVRPAPNGAMSCGSGYRHYQSEI